MIIGMQHIISKHVRLKQTAWMMIDSLNNKNISFKMQHLYIYVEHLKRYTYLVINIMLRYIIFLFPPFFSNYYKGSRSDINSENGG